MLDTSVISNETFGETNFFDTSNAGTSQISNDISATNFFHNSSAGSAYIVASQNGAESLSFFDNSTAGDATIDLSSFSFNSNIARFADFSTAGSATIIVWSSSLTNVISFEDFSQGGTAQIQFLVSPDEPNLGILDIGAHNAPGLTIGSIEGEGNVFLGANNVTVGSNNLSTTFSGVMQDGGSFTKIGPSTLELTGANIYTGATTIEGGKLVVNNMTGSGTGTGVVQVNAGRLCGRGTIAGAVTVGSGSGAGAALAPGRRGAKADALTIQGALTFQLDSTYKFELKASSGNADKVVANGITINSGAQFSPSDLGSAVLPTSTVFTAVDNTAATPIAGTFANLADGSTFTIGSNTFQASYEGGDGNDLTLTVVP